MRSERALVLVALLAAGGCQQSIAERRPSFGDSSLIAGAPAPPPHALVALEGVFDATSEAERFDSLVVTHATRHTLSIFGAKAGVYAILSAGCLDGGERLVLEGHWRFAATHEDGLITLDVEPVELARAICSGTVVDLASLPAPRLEGRSGEGGEAPDRHERFRFDRALRPVITGSFDIVAHKGACRTVDGCGASENSVEAIRLAEALGASAIEIDVRMTADGVPVLYHDPDLSERVTDGVHCRGPLANFSLDDLRAFCRLENGERIPTLEEALEVAARETDLTFAWLDMKDAAAFPATRDLIARLAGEWRAIGRVFPVRLGLPDEAARVAYDQLGEGAPPCIAEGDEQASTARGCWGWGPRWTQIREPGELAHVQEGGVAVIFWTMDESEFIDRVLARDRPNGIISNRSSVVFHRFQLIGSDPVGP